MIISHYKNLISLILYYIFKVVQNYYQNLYMIIFLEYVIYILQIKFSIFLNVYNKNLLKVENFEYIVIIIHRSPSPPNIAVIEKSHKSSIKC